MAGFALALLLACIGWQAVLATRADRLAVINPVAALRLDPDHPQALLLRARRELADGDYSAATATARHLLQVAPGQGDAFAIIALAASASHAPEGERLLEIAAQRAPRIPQARAQLAALRLQAGDLTGAMRQLDALLRFDPAQGERLFPALAAQSAEPRFARVVIDRLVRHPRWRRSFLAALNAKGSPTAIDNINSGLLDQNDLSRPEASRWLDGLIAQGRWGDAFSRWFGTLHPTPTHLPSVRNGKFEDPVDGLVFGWRNVSAAGAFTDIEEGAGQDGGRAAHTQFIGRPAPRGNLRQALLLVPGHYRLSFRIRAESLRSDGGLTWVVQCDQGRLIAISAPIAGSFDWKRMSVDFEVPEKRCVGQWLGLRNPAVPGMAQQVSGDLWTDDVAITPSGAD